MTIVVSLVASGSEEEFANVKSLRHMDGQTDRWPDGRWTLFDQKSSDELITKMSHTHRQNVSDNCE